MSRSQLREQICQISKSDRQEWQSLVVLNGTSIFLNGTNISFLKFICGILNQGVANFFWNHVIQISSRQMHFQDIYFNLWKVKVLIGNIYSLKWNTYFCGTVMFVQDGFLYLIVTKHKLTVRGGSEAPIRRMARWGLLLKRHGTSLEKSNFNPRVCFLRLLLHGLYGPSHIKQF